jgi:hypothetical protein
MLAHINRNLVRFVFHMTHVFAHNKIIRGTINKPRSRQRPYSTIAISHVIGGLPGVQYGSVVPY